MNLIPAKEPSVRAGLAVSGASPGGMMTARRRASHWHLPAGH